MTPYYDEDGITIYHGDALDVLPHLSGIACTVTSPPYNTLRKRTQSQLGMHRNNGWVEKVNTVGYSDDMTEDEYAEWQRSIADAIRAASAPGASFFYNHKCRWRDGVILHPIDIVRTFDGWTFKQELIWDRSGSMTFNARMFAASDERIYWLVRDGGEYLWNQEAASFLSVWRILPRTDVDGHPCPYPVTLPNRCILATTNPGDTVLDPFMGSGTTLRSAKDNGRRAIGIEISEKYCELAVKRLAQDVLDFGGAA